MNSKIVGFIVSKSEISFTPKINTNLKVKHLKHRLGIASVYYYGNLSACLVEENKYSLGFPSSGDLLDHNLLITIREDEIIIENDWLGSIPVFYNLEENIISSFPKVCLAENKEFDELGLFNYLKYGFSVYERTPFKQVRFLPFYSKLTFNAKGTAIEQKEDPVKRIDAFKNQSETDIWNKIDAYCQEKESKVIGDIVIPTSAGFDSRIANYFIHDRKRVKNYTYGISGNQEKSFEVKQAQKYSQNLGHEWEQIFLKDAFKYIDEWHDQFAFSTHLHGMYHIEFYKKVKQLLGDNPVSMVSGICGGVFCGANQYVKVSEPKELCKLAFTHGLNFEFNTGDDEYSQEKQFMDRYGYMFDDIRMYPIITMRIKLLLLSYSINVPSLMGLPGWTPFLKFETVMSMLNLPAKRRENRTWVKEFFAAKNMLPSENMFFQDTTNRLNFNLHNNYTFEPLASDFSLPSLTEETKAHINNYLGNIDGKAKLKYRLTTTRIIKEILKKAGVKNEFFDRLTDYQTLKAIEMSL